MSIPLIDRAEKRRIEKAIRNTSDKNYARRLMAILMVSKGYQITEIASNLAAARSSINRWLNWYNESGIRGLKGEKSGRKAVLPHETINLFLLMLLHIFPSSFGYLRSRWSSELFALEIERHLGIKIHSSTIRRRLKKLDVKYKRARPTLYIKDPAKDEKLKQIGEALESCCQRVAVFYSDEVDIDLNPKIGFSWQEKDQQTCIATPGKNQKRYLAGALHANTGKVIYVEGQRKNSVLFIQLLEQLKKSYRNTEKIVLIVDNYIIHKSRITRKWLQNNPKVELIFQPVYSPWVNKIERLWKQLHETITRNHQEKSMNTLMEKVRAFMGASSPFPGNKHGTAYSESRVAQFGSVI